eukprot:3271608-Amphidinium_carterae.1
MSSCFVSKGRSRSRYSALGVSACEGDVRLVRGSYLEDVFANSTDPVLALMTQSRVLVALDGDDD